MKPKYKFSFRKRFSVNELVEFDAEFSALKKINLPHLSLQLQLCLIIQIDTIEHFIFQVNLHIMCFVN
jgi:hypothetical protein